MKSTEQSLSIAFRCYFRFTPNLCSIALPLNAMKYLLIGLKCPLYAPEHPLNEMKNALNQLIQTVILIGSDGGWGLLPFYV